MDQWFPWYRQTYDCKALLSTLLDEGDPLLIDNHSLIDLGGKNFSRDHRNYLQERRPGREAVFKSFVEDPAFRTRIVIFTGERNQPALTFLYPSLIQFRV